MTAYFLTKSDNTYVCIDHKRFFKARKKGRMEGGVGPVWPQVFSGPTNWLAALQLCIAQGGTLANVESQAEQDLVQDSR